MNVQFLNPFVEAAYIVLEHEVGLTAQRGALTLKRSASTAYDVTVLISLVGQVKGVVLYSLSQKTAVRIASKTLEQPFAEFDQLAQSGIAELGQVITNQAGKRLAEAGYDASISAPTIILGKGTLISSLDFERLQVPLETEYGRIQIDLAIRELHPHRRNGSPPSPETMKAFASEVEDAS